MIVENVLLGFGEIATVKTLLLMMVGVAGGLIAGAVSLRTTFLYGEKKSRFASAVTHELRTPLTTFQMYTELLADPALVEATARLLGNVGLEDLADGTYSFAVSTLYLVV